MFRWLEQLIKSPGYFLQQSIFHVEQAQQRVMIERYYEFDDVFARELLGKHVTSSKLRRDVEDMSDKTGIPLPSCTRQFENIRRVYKETRLVDAGFVESIQQMFFISRELAT